MKPELEAHLKVHRDNLFWETLMYGIGLIVVITFLFYASIRVKGISNVEEEEPDEIDQSPNRLLNEEEKEL